MNDQALADGWYVSRESELVGPLSDQELRDRVARGALGRDEYAWRDGMELWTQLRDLPGVVTAARMSAPALDRGRPAALPEAVAPSRPPKASKPPKQSAQKRRNEATTRAGQTAPPASPAGSPWQLPPAGDAKDFLGEALKRLSARGFKLPPLVIGLIAAGFIVPPLAVPLWLLAFVAYLRSK